MKTRFYILSIIISLAVFSSCEKRPFDYRNKYCGDWEFTVEAYSFSYVDSIPHDTIFYQTGKIWYENKGKVIIKYDVNSDYENEYLIDKSGELSIEGSHSFSGEFIDKKNVTIHSYSGGLGGGSSRQIKGIKK